jgi:SAM-dependent methyltransferase
MSRRIFLWLRLTALALACLCAAPASAQGAPVAADYKPAIGQDGKDVIWIPTESNMIERMLRMAQVTPRDLVVDLGSGDGRVSIAAAREFGARARGLEFNPDMVALSRREAQQAGVAERVKFEEADIFKSDFSDASVVTMFLLPELTLRLRPTLLKMKPGASGRYLEAGSARDPGLRTHPAAGLSARRRLGQSGERPLQPARTATHRPPPALRAGRRQGPAVRVRRPG